MYFTRLLVTYGRKTAIRAKIGDVNRLANATSPYLLQHAENPVDWWEWSPEALANARETDRPILLSVGYASCHWCHVMAHESFEDEHVAAFMNEHFVNIKVDREERPDIDAIYMRATTAMTGNGGWPMTCILTPDGQPFFTGTYFPPEPRPNHPAFSQILQALAEAWRDRRAEVLESADSITAYLNEATLAESGSLTDAVLDTAAAELLKQADRHNGGFGGAPKFPPTMALEFLSRHAARTRNAEAFAVVDQTFETMARSGLNDQLGGGFARYSVDARWDVPHFEKMLYDNSLLLAGYTHWRTSLLARGENTRAAFAERILRETAEFLLRELRTEQGGFASGLDADSEGHEGTFYVWNREQLAEVLGETDGAWAAELLHVTAAGTFERGFSTLQLRSDPDSLGDAERWDEIRTKLFKSRVQRVRPERDDKVVAAWNGLAISALAEAGTLLAEPAWIKAATEAAELIWNTHRAGTEQFARTSLAGKPGANSATLEDLGLVAGSYQTLFAMTGDSIWWERANFLLGRIATEFADPAGGFFDTAASAETLIARPQDFADNASPCGNSAALAAFLRHSAVTGDEASQAQIDTVLERFVPLMEGAPRFASWALAQAEAHHAGPMQIAIVGTAGSELHRVALAQSALGAVVVVGTEGTDVPLFAQRTRQGGKDTAYVCRNFTCELPVTDPEALAAQLSN